MKYNISTNKNYNYTTTAFTLAEVLITLGIIGVVAAITMPTLLTNLQNKKLESQFKESYSSLARAVRIATNDNESFFDKTQGFNYRNFIQYFNGATDCGSTGEVSDDSDFCMIRQQNIDGNAGTVTNKDKITEIFPKHHNIYKQII